GGGRGVRRRRPARARDGRRARRSRPAPSRCTRAPGGRPARRAGRPPRAAPPPAPPPRRPGAAPPPTRPRRPRRSRPPAGPGRGPAGARPAARARTPAPPSPPRTRRAHRRPGRPPASRRPRSGGRRPAARSATAWRRRPPGRSARRSGRRARRQAPVLRSRARACAGSYQRGETSARDSPPRVGAWGENVAVTALLPLDEARARAVAAVAAPLEAQAVVVGDALGRVLAEDVLAAADVPPFANSAMDGFAVLAGPAGRALRVVDESRAGRPARRPVGEGEAIRISTGAPLPAGATAVVPVEHTAERDGAVVLEREAPPHANVRDAGEDLSAGAVVVRRGAVLGPPEVAAAVAAGRAEVRCARRPRAAILVTGAALAPPGAPLGPGQIHDSNAVALAALAAREGTQMVREGIVPDDRAGTEEALK